MGSEVVFKPTEKIAKLTEEEKSLDPTQVLKSQFYRRYYKRLGGGVTNGVTTIYTVPDGKIFVLLSASLAMQIMDPANCGDSYVSISTFDSPNIIEWEASATGVTTANQNFERTISFAEGIPIFQKSLFKVRSGNTGCRAVSNFIGYLIDA
jgi:hypothetical protein